LLTKEAIFRKVANREISREEAMRLLKAQIPGAKAAEPKPVSPPKPTAPRDDLPRRFPISELQKALWFYHQVSPEDYAYNIPLAFKLHGRIKAETVRKAIDFIVTRHRGLRTTFESGDQVVQVIAERPNHEFQVIDAGHWTEAELTENLHRFGKEAFDLANGPLFKARYYERGDQPPALMIVVHHIIFDGTSSGNLVNEFHQVFTALAQDSQPNLPPIKADYADFVTWQQGFMSGEEGRQSLDYWRDRLAGELPILELPADRSRSGDNVGEVLEVKIDPEVMASLKNWSLKKGVSLFTTLLTVTKILLYRYTHQADIIVGTPMAGRPERRFRSMLGYFINMVALRTQMDANRTFDKVVEDVQDAVLGALDHANYPFPNLVRELGIEPDALHPPIFQVCFILQSWSQSLNMAAFDEKGDGPLRLEPLTEIHETGGYDLTVEILEVDDYATAHFKYNGQLFDHDRIERLATHFQNLIQAMMATPESNIGALPLMSDAERDGLLAQMRGPKPGYQPCETIYELIEAQAAQRPEADALVFEDEKMSYCQLDRRANQLAHLLRRRGVGPEVMVGLCMERGLDTIVSLLAILKAGGCYVPMDPAYPKERIAAILADTTAPVLLTATALLENLPEHAGLNLCVDRVWTDHPDLPEEPLPKSASADNPAYAIFTSGSTGKPKGVLVPHRALVNYCRHFTAHYKVTEADRMLQFASLSFDTAAEEIYPTLISGATLVLRRQEDSHTMRGFLKLLTRHQITLLDLPTAYWHEMVADMEDGDCEIPASVRLVIVGGEAASLDRLETWRQKIGDRMVWSNTYGPTEATIVATLFEPNFQAIEAAQE